MRSLALVLVLTALRRLGSADSLFDAPWRARAVKSRRKLAAVNNQKELLRVERLTFKEACALQERLEQELQGAVECPEDKRERLTLGSSRSPGWLCTGSA